MINVAGYVNDSITDGPGLRFTLFLQGCPHRCAGCHNPNTHSFGTNKPMTAGDIFDIIKKNPILYGVTFSGGEPICQSRELLPLAKMIKDAKMDLAIYSGFTYEELIEQNDADINNLLSLANILIDGKFCIDQKSLSLKFRGSSNQRIIDLSKTRQNGRVELETSDRWN